MTLKHVFLPVSILKLKDLTLGQKIILALVVSFSQGLKLNNGALGEILGISEGHVSRMVADLWSKGYIGIKNSRSKYRRIYLSIERKVEGVLLAHTAQSKESLLCGLSQSTSAQVSNITKGTENSITEGGISSDEFVALWNDRESLPTIRRFTPQRRKRLVALSRESDFADNWRLIIEKLSRSPFHTGQSKSKWRATVDWLLTSDNYMKILELPDEDCAAPTRDVTEEEADELLKEVAAC